MPPEQEFTTLSVSLSRALKTWIEQRVATGGYGNVSDYIRELVRRDQKDVARDELEQKLLSALESGERIQVTPEYWEEKRRQLLERHGKKKRKKAQ